jgi:hypothetical protein
MNVELSDGNRRLGRAATSPRGPGDFRGVETPMEPPKIVARPIDAMDERMRGEYSGGLLARQRLVPARVPIRILQSSERMEGGQLREDGDGEAEAGSDIAQRRLQNADG